MLAGSTNASGRWQVLTGVLSATLVGLEASTRTLAAPVRLMFDSADPNATLAPEPCVYWDWRTAAWARNGCALATDARDTCVCSHLTYFSLLFVRFANYCIILYAYIDSFDRCALRMQLCISGTNA